MSEVHLIINLRCDCSITETEIGIKFYRSLDCTLKTHFTKDGWPALVDAVKADILMDGRE